MKDILQEIVAHKRQEVAEAASRVPAGKLMQAVAAMEAAERTQHTVRPSMRRALENSATGIIAEFKRKSPSKGWIKESGRPDVIPPAYQRNGTAAISILADSAYFGGGDEMIAAARAAGVTIPVLYKNFVIDAYQLLQARLCGASAVLLIAAALPVDTCGRLLEEAHRLGLEVLLELHGGDDFAYTQLEADMFGINNRHLGTFETDVRHSFRMAERLPAAACRVSESGISDPATVLQLRAAGFRGFLIGECFMRADDPGAALRRFIEEIKNAAS